VKDFLATGGSVLQALKDYVAEVREGRFPTPEQSYE
jgi:ketopantoate hydroxymethyltransferase